MKSLSNTLVFAVLAAVLFLATACPSPDKPSAPPAATIANPIGTGADPWIVRHEGRYYWTLTDTERGVAIWCSDNPASLGKRKIVWRAPATGPHSNEIWAPELHFLDGRWYIYVAASDGNNATHRMIVLESATADPLGEYTFKGELYTGDNIGTGEKNRWAVDGTVLTYDGRRYFIWSGWEDERDIQWLYAAPMSNPWTISGNRVRLCANDDYQWERVGESMQGRGLNEAPQILQRNGRIFLIYSASGSWQATYKMGLLELTGADPLAPGAWRKHPAPVFAPTQNTFGLGHASFAKSPDGKQDWLVYHVKQERKDGWSRLIFAQPFRWTKGGFPDFGKPVSRDEPMPAPATPADFDRAVPPGSPGATSDEHDGPGETALPKNPSA
jgi:GH43 family beta-xylosidase